MVTGVVQEIRPQVGPQTAFLSSPADIVFYGGGAGGGKSWSILLEAVRNIANPKFNATYFRRTFPQIRNPGGLWDASMAVFPLVGGVPRQSALKWVFPSGAYAVMRHLKQESNVLDWQGTELVYVAMDELTHFSEFMFWYILSRMRSTSGVAPYFRGTCNPVTVDDPTGGWVRKMIDWWIGEDGLAIAERSGVVRHFLRRDGEIVWFDEPTAETKSFTFIRSSVYDNPALLKKDPNYLNNLKALPQVERERLLGGNWNVKAVSGKVFRHEWFEVIDQLPLSVLQNPQSKRVRFWDFAGTIAKNRGDDPDWTVGVEMLLAPDGIAYVLDAIVEQQTPAGVDRLVVNTASQDGRGCAVRWFQDPGQAGLYQGEKLRSQLRGYDACGVVCQLDKYNRAKPFSRAAELGEVKLLRGGWNQGFLNELSQFPDARHDDQVDGASGAYNELTGANVRRFGMSQMRG
jgi:predicted phage terminase large subunit-like protein